MNDLTHPDSDIKKVTEQRINIMRDGEFKYSITASEINDSEATVEFTGDVFLDGEKIDTISDSFTLKKYEGQWRVWEGFDCFCVTNYF